ncbi:MAG: hypothetical protein ACKVRP_12990 [Bacteroidota bacterium]
MTRRTGFQVALILGMCLSPGERLAAGIVLSNFSAVPVSHNRVQLEWSTAYEDFNYGFWVQRSLNGPTNYETVPGSFSPGFGAPHSYSVTDTTSSPGVWYYRLQQMGLDSSLWYSHSIIVNVPAQQPTLVAPPNNTTGIPATPALVWRTAIGATTYHLQVSLDSLFSPFVLDNPAVSDTTFSIGPLSNLTRYFWRVRANGTPASSPFSLIRNFTTIVAPPAQVNLVSPADGDTIAETSVEFVWRTGGPAVSSYTIELATDSLFTALIVDSTVSDTTLQLHSLMHQQKYWWRVKATNSGGSGPFGNARRFSVNFIVGIEIAAGWNMISNPILTTEDSLRQLFPNATSSGFSFNPTTGYMPEVVLENGTGYWAKFATASTNEVGGAPITTDYIPVLAGWNIIGSISVPVDTADVVTSPPGIRVSPFYGYSNGIVVAPAIEPGKAYWVKVNAPGFIILSEE